MRCLLAVVAVVAAACGTADVGVPRDQGEGSPSSFTVGAEPHDEQHGPPLPVLANRGPEWEDLPVPPVPIGGRGAVVWTGSLLVVWGGEDAARPDSGAAVDAAAAYDPAARAWRSIAKPPLAATTGPTDGAWTGTEVLVWNDQGGAAWTPAANTWRTVGGFPAGAPRTVWSGKELLAWEQAVAVHPVSGATRPLPALPFAEPAQFGVPPKAWWTGAVVQVFGPGFFWQLDPEVGWTQLRVPGLYTAATDAAWDGTSVLAVDYEMRARRFEHASGDWRSLDPLPLRFSECSPKVLAEGGLVWVGLCGGGVVVTERGWRPLLSSQGHEVLADGWLYFLHGWAPRRVDLRRPPSVIPIGVAGLVVPEGFELAAVAGLEDLPQPGAPPHGRLGVTLRSARSTCDVTSTYTGGPGALAGQQVVIGAVPATELPSGALVVATSTSDHVEIACTDPADARTLAGALRTVPFEG